MATKEKLSAEQFLPKRRTLESLRAAARSCKGCDLYKNATQTVFGEGAKDANLVLVGEQPGDMEDRQGILSLDRRVECWTKRSAKRVYPERTFISPTP